MNTHSCNLSLMDTHVHLCDPTFANDLQDVLQRARNCGITALLAVGENVADAQANLKLAEIYPEVLPAAGLYPGNADLDQAEAMIAFIRQHRERLAAIGEVGLDFRLAETEAEKWLQREVFKEFIALSGELDLPLNVHSRSAGRHAVNWLLQHGANRVQLHAFDGKAGAALAAVEAGYFFSVPPSAMRSRQKQKLIKQLPLSCLLLETDAPVLGPIPNERNEPQNLVFSLKAAAEIKDIPEDQILEAVQRNTQRLYRGPTPSLLPNSHQARSVK